MGKGAPPPVSFSKIRNMTTHNTQAHQYSAVPISSTMSARNTGLLFVKHAGYKITDAMTTGTGKRCEAMTTGAGQRNAIEPNSRSFSNSTVRGGHRKQGRHAQNRTRPMGLCLGGGAPDPGFGEEAMERSSCMTFAMPPNEQS